MNLSPSVKLIYQIWVEKVRDISWAIEKLRKAWVLRIPEYPPRDDLAASNRIIQLLGLCVDESEERKTIPEDLIDFLRDAIVYVDEADYENSNSRLPFEPGLQYKFYPDPKDKAIAWATKEILFWHQKMKKKKNEDWMILWAKQHLQQLKHTIDYVYAKDWITGAQYTSLEALLGPQQEFIGRKWTPAQEAKIHKVMREYEHKKLYSGRGKNKRRVRTRKQAQAIALSEARKIKR